MYASISLLAINLHPRYSPLLKPRPHALSLSLSLSLHHCTDQSQCRTVDCLFGALWSPLLALLPSYRHSSLSVPPIPPYCLPDGGIKNKDNRAVPSHTKPDNPLSLKQVVLGLSLLTVCSVSSARRSTTCTTTIQNFPLYPSSGFPWPRLIRAQVIGFK